MSDNSPGPPLYVPPRLYSQSPKGLRIRDQRVGRLTQKILRAAPWLTPLDEPLIRAFAQTEILSNELYEKVHTEGLLRPDGNAHPLLGHFRSLRRTHADLAGRLGLSPRDRAQMQHNSTDVALARIDLGRLNKVLRDRYPSNDADNAVAGNDHERANNAPDRDHSGSDRSSQE